MTAQPLAPSAPSVSAREHAPRSRRALRLTLAAAAVAWNAFGVAKFLESVRSTPESLERMGMTAHQAAVYSSYPVWMSVAFAVGVFAGLAGSVLLLAGRSKAVPVFGASLLGYIVLFVGDATEGVFAALGTPQVAVLSTVLLIAGALFAWSRSLARQGFLRT
jgi:hypothetical protein